VKHQYFGDVNDYRKYGLLRALQTPGTLSLAVGWMLSSDDLERFVLSLMPPTVRKDWKTAFADIEARVALLQDPAKLVSERVISELEGNERFYMLTKPYRPRL